VLDKAGTPSQLRTYYLVDLETGKTRVFLKDRTAKQAGHGISEIYWIGGAGP
jgi:hypothetical protein